MQGSFRRMGLLTAAVFATFWTAAPLPAEAASVDMLIEKLVSKGVLTRLDAEQIRVEVETEEKRSFIQLRKETNPWLEGITQKGDVRLRYEGFSRENEDSSDRNRYRARVRWGVEKQFDDTWAAGFRLATGSATEATSTNQTLTGEFNLKSIFLERAYGKYTPTQEWQRYFSSLDKAEFGAGKVENPYDRDKWNATILWDSDVTPEGIYEQMDFKLGEWENDAWWKLNWLSGQFSLNEDSDLSPGDHGMMAYGLGTTYQWAKGYKSSFKATYYDWQNYAHFLKANSALSSSSGGADRELDDFKIINLYNDWDFDAQTGLFGTQPVKVYWDYAHNTDAQTDATGTDGSTEAVNPSLRNDEDDAYSVGFTLGKAKDKGTWSSGYEYLYIEPNAVVGTFAESDLGVGHANNKGHKLSCKYMVIKDLEFNATFWLVEKVNKTKITYGGSDFRPNGDDDELLRVQLDLVYKF